MSKKGVPIVFISCLVLVWLFGGQPVKKTDPIPADGLIGVVASVKDAMGKNSHESHKIDFMTVQPSGNSGQLPNSSEFPNSSPSPSDRHEKARREIVIFSIEGCRDCDQWKRCEKAKFEADGWQVVDGVSPVKGPWPFFIIDANNKQTEHRGYLSFEKLREVVK